MDTTRDYYEILGITKGSSVDEVKKAYRQLVMKHHPDRVPSEKKKEVEERFKEISEAYAVLSDPEKKKLYDQYGHAGIDSRYTTEDIFKGADFSSIFGGRGGVGDIFEHIFSDFGADMFGGRRTSGYGRKKRVGEDLQLKVTITLEEASTGLEKDISFYRYDNCSECNGSGSEPGSSKVRCSTCDGNGAVRGGMGFISFSQTCPTCGGEGKIIKNRCKKCSGEGRIKKKRNLKVNIPQGVNNDSVLRLKEEGNFAGEGRGDLYLYTEVSPHSIFMREGHDIRCKVTISTVKAILGADIKVPTLNGEVKMKVPAGTQPSTIFRLRGKGIMDLRTKRQGDEYVEVEIKIPDKLSSKERNLLLEFAKLHGEI